MERLPREILDFIYSNLDAPEARSLRVCCKTLADVGAHHCFRQITFFLCRRDFQRLRNIARHEVIRRHVKLLVYMADNLPARPKSLSEYVDTTQNAVYRRRVEKNKNNLLPPEALLVNQPPAALLVNLPPALGPTKVNPISADHIQHNYRQYVAAVAEQREILSTREDFAVLEEVLPRLTNLREISVRNAGWGMGDFVYDSPFDGFFEYTMCSLAPEGVRQLEAVMHGLERSGLQLNKLSAGSLDVELIDKSFFEKVVRSCGTGLERLQLCFDTADNNARLWDDDTSEIIKARARTETGDVGKFLKQLPNLTELSLEFTASSMHETLYPGALCNIISPNFQWHQLRELSLTSIEMERTELFAVFKLHRKTLRYIGIHNCRLITTSWTRLLKQMKEVLDLKDIYIYGNLEGKIEDEQDYPSIKNTDDDEHDEWEDEADPDTENWWLGNPDIESDYSLSHGITDWFLLDKPYPLVRPRMRFRSAFDAHFEGDEDTPGSWIDLDGGSDADDTEHDSNEEYIQWSGDDHAYQDEGGQGDEDTEIDE